MSKAEFIANVAKAGEMSNAEAKRVVELVFGEIENGLKELAEQTGQNLAKLRADVAERYLTAGGLGRGRVVVRSAGARRPRTGKVDPLSQHQNRRVDIFIVER